MSIIEITPDIAIDAARQPDWLHKDSADQTIVATARSHVTRITARKA